MLKLFKSTPTLLASKIDVNPAPSSGEHYLFIEGNKIGFIAWLLKILGLKDPSVKIIVDDKLIKRVDGGKKFSVAPTSSIYGFTSGYSNKKLYLVLMILMACLTLYFLVKAPILAIILAALGFLFFWLYKRSGAIEVSIACYKDGFGVDMRVKSGLTGKKLDKSDFENIFNAIRNVSEINSKFYKQ